MGVTMCAQLRCTYGLFSLYLLNAKKREREREREKLPEMLSITGRSHMREMNTT
jgi:hypothetical protein